MANSPRFTSTQPIVSINAITALLNSGFLNIYDTGPQPEVDGAIVGTRLAARRPSARPPWPRPAPGIRSSPGPRPCAS